MGRTTRKQVESRVVGGSWRVLWQAAGLALEEGRETAEKFLRERGLLSDTERLFSVEMEMDHHGQPRSPSKGGFFNLRATARDEC